MEEKKLIEKLLDLLRLQRMMACGRVVVLEMEKVGSSGMYSEGSADRSC